MHFKPALQKSGLILLGLFLGLAVLESALRIWALLVLSAGDVKSRDSLEQKASCRVLCIGESTTRKQYPLYLQEYLNQRSSGRKFTVIDKGISGTNTTVILTWIESQLDLHRPDIVVAMMGINDPPAKSSRAASFISSLRSYKLFQMLALNLTAKLSRFGSAAQDPLPAGMTDSEYVELGWSYRKKEQFSLAGRAFQEAAVLNPKNDRAYTGLGWVYRIQGEYAAAEDALKKALEINPQNSVAHLNLGWLYFDQNRLSLAESELRLSLCGDPNDDIALTTLGDLYHELSRIEDAQEAYKQAIAVNPANNEPRMKLGWLYAGRRNPVLSEEVFWETIKINPGDSRLYLELGRSYWRQGKFGLVEGVLKKAVALNPGNDRLHAALGLFYELRGKKILAGAYRLQAKLLRLAALNPVTSSNYLRLKQILERRGIRLVCVQYPMRNVLDLKRIFAGNERGVVFVDNQGSFQEAVLREGYFRYFVDLFGGDFGHCKERGNRLLAENIAKAILGGN